MGDISIPAQTGRLLCTVGLLALLSGCAGPLGTPIGQPPVAAGSPNPLVVAGGDRDFVFDQVVDAVDDYFKIDAERRIQNVGGVLTQGRIDTFPVVGATVLEPWREEFDTGPETLHNTLQTIRRYAVVDITPTGGGFMIHVQVMKELEDLSRPEYTSFGSSSPRTGGSLDRSKEEFSTRPVPLGWIPLGRDIVFEQRILIDILARLQRRSLRGTAAAGGALSRSALG